MAMIIGIFPVRGSRNQAKQSAYAHRNAPFNLHLFGVQWVACFRRYQGGKSSWVCPSSNNHIFQHCNKFHVLVCTIYNGNAGYVVISYCVIRPLNITLNTKTSNDEGYSCRNECLF